VDTRIRKRAMTLAACALALALVLTACSSSKKSSSSSGTNGSGGSSASGPTINVGVIGSLTGAQASSSNQGATVAPAWADWINANGGIAGHPVKVYVADDKGDPSDAQAAYQSLLSHNVVAIIVSSDNEVSAFDSAAISAGLPLISGSANSTDWYTKAGMFPTPTGVLPGVNAQVAVGVKYGHATNFANLYCAEIAACAQASPILQSATKTAGIGYVGVSISSTAPSYTAQCVLLQQKKVDYAQLNFTATAAVKFVQSCQAQNYNPTWGSSEQAAGTPFASLSNFTMYGPAYAFPSVADAPPVNTFVSAMEKYATNSNWREGTASFTWGGLQALAKAIQDANVASSTAVTRQDVLTGLYSFKDENLGGLLANGLTYTQGKAVGFQFNPCYFVVGMSGGKTTAPAGLTPQCPSTSG
jgi:branched-chain amino acid transport system substrate-binding protein